MHAYLLLAGQPDALTAERTARTALERLISIVPDIGSEPRISIQPVSELSGALGILCPAKDYATPLSQTARSERFLAFCHGRLVGVRNTAEAVISAFEAGGMREVQALDGSFAALLIDRAERVLFVCTDLIGMRAPHYTVRPSAIAVASHDVLLVSAGQVEGDVDPLSVASLVACTWSLSGTPLVKGVSRCPPYRWLKWRSGAEIEAPMSSPLTDGERIHPLDERGLAACHEEIIEAMRAATVRCIAGVPQVRASITAGLDSRATLALIHAARPTELVTSTIGRSDSLDVKVGSALSELIGAEHRVQLPKPPDDAALEAHNLLCAFSMNGMDDARRALCPLPRWNPERNVLLGGQGGEIFRGFFYQYFGATGNVPADLESVSSRLLRWRFRRLRQLAFADADVVGQVEQRLTHALEDYRAILASSYDVLDLLYLFERSGQWGAAGDRNTWSRRWSPFHVKPAIRALYRLPAPVGKNCEIHAPLVRRFLPLAAYLKPINGSSWLWLEGPGRARYLARQLLNVQGKLRDKLARRTRPSAATGDDIRSSQIRGAYARDLLASPSSLGRELFDGTQLQALFDGAAAGCLGYLLNAEAFRRLLLQARPRKG